MLGSDVPFSSWANQPFEIQNFLSPFTSAILRLACSTSRTVMFRLLRRPFSFSPAGTALLASFWTVELFSLVASRRDAEFRDREDRKLPLLELSRLQPSSYKVRAQCMDQCKP